MNRKDDKKNLDHKNGLEWTVFFCSILLVAGVLAYLIFKTYTYKNSIPEIHVELAPSPTITAPYLYHVLVKNKGGETAEEVKIELVMQRENVIIDKAELQLAFVPQKSQREGWLNLSQKVSDGDTVVARVVSFKKP